MNAQTAFPRAAQGGGGRIVFCWWALAVWLLVAGCRSGNNPGAPRQSSPSAPSIVIDEPVFDFGQIGYGQAKIEHHFVFRNAGGMPLHIQGVKSSCGCAVAKSEKRVLQPGEESRVDVVLDVHSIGDAEPGHPIEKIVVVQSNDPVAPAMKLVLRGTRVKNHFYYPSVVALPPVFVGQTAKQEAYYLPSTQAMADVVPSVGTTADYLKARIERQHFDASPLPRGLTEATKEFSFAVNPASYPRDGYVINVDLLSNAPAGEFFHYITLMTGDPVDPQIMIRVVGEIREPLEILPRRVFLGLLDRDSQLNRQITVRSPQRRPFVILSVTSEIEMIVPSVQRIAPDQWTIALQLAPGAYRAGDFRGHLAVTTDFPTMEKFTLGVYGRAAD